MQSNNAASQKNISTVSIRPGVSILSVLPHLNYKSWFALAEFVDNSLQSAISSRKKLELIDGKDFILRVDIELDPSMEIIRIRDNAGGIATGDYSRAFRPAEIPPDAGGLSEFGMGMKSAACWFAPNWHVRSTALGENEERTVFFDIDKIVQDSIEELEIINQVAPANDHYTEVVLENIRRFPKSKTIAKIKDHLASIYRCYLRDGLLRLFFDGEELKFTDPKIFNAPYYKTPDSPAIEWRKEIDIDLAEGGHASGFVAIREKGDTRRAGLALFRRKRLIIGSGDEPYRPEGIFGRPNSFESQRIFGEIHLKGFQVSHTKDGISWEESEYKFIDKLREAINSETLPLIQQARNYRVSGEIKSQKKTAIKALKTLATDLNKKEIISTSPPSSNPDHKKHTPTDLPTDIDSDEISFKINYSNETWLITVRLSYDAGMTDWLTISERPSPGDEDPRAVGIRLSMLHPFMERFASTDNSAMEPIIRLAATLGLSEIVAVESGVEEAGAVRHSLNDILYKAMAKT